MSRLSSELKRGYTALPASRRAWRADPSTSENSEIVAVYREVLTSLRPRQGGA